MNKIILIGRLTRDPEINYSQSDNPIAIARYSIAVDKKQKRDDGVTADFINIVAFDRLGDFAAKYLYKGMKVALTGRVQTGTYENKDGVKMPFFEVVAEEQEFVESKSASQTNSGTNSKSSNSADRNVVDDMDELPFN